MEENWFHGHSYQFMYSCCLINSTRPFSKFICPWGAHWSLWFFFICYNNFNITHISSIFHIKLCTQKANTTKKCDEKTKCPKMMMMMIIIAIKGMNSKKLTSRRSENRDEQNRTANTNMKLKQTMSFFPTCVLFTLYIFMLFIHFIVS